MGPLVPTIISNQFDLIIALILGFGFGFILEQAGFSSSRKLIGLFYGKNFIVLKVFFTAGITAMILVLVSGQLGLLDLSLIYINPTFLTSAIIGGLIMGIGFIVGGFCPGTSICASAIGKLDGITFVMGGFLGVYLFMEIYPLIEGMYFAGNMGNITIYEVLGITPITFAIILSAMAIVIFVAVTYIESRINGNPFVIAKKSVIRMSLIAIVPFIIITVTGFIPDRTTRLKTEMSNPSNLAMADTKALDADKLAFEVVNNYYKWTIIDIRPKTEYEKWHIPLSINIPMDSLMNREWEIVLKQKFKKNLFYSDNLMDSKKAFVLAEMIGEADNYILQNTATEFNSMFYNPEKPGDNASKDLVNLYNFRIKSAKQMEDLAKSLERFHTKPKVVIRKRAQGGCS